MVKLSQYLRRRGLKLEDQVKRGKWDSLSNFKEWCVRTRLFQDIPDESISVLFHKEEDEKEPAPKEEASVIETPKPIEVVEPKVPETPLDVEENKNFSKMKVKELREEVKKSGQSPLGMTKSQMVSFMAKFNESTQDETENSEE